MLIIVGSLIVFISMLSGFMIAGGNPIVLLHISEFVIILGIAGGVLITASPKSVLMSIVADTKACLSGKGGSADDFMDLMKLIYEIFMLGRKSGLIALDEHMSDPGSSTIFTKYPSFALDKENVLVAEIQSKEKEAHSGVAMLHLVGDSLPGIGIVAAVLGIINTMSAIAEGPERVGQSVAATLTGIFLGIFAAYGLINPLAQRIVFLHKTEFLYYNTICRAISSFAKGLAPIIAIEIARRSLEKNVQPGADELEAILKGL